MSDWLFIFGRTHELSFHELVSVVPLPITSIAPGVARVEDPLGNVVPEREIKKLGGTVKVAREKGRIQTITAEEVLPYLHVEGKQLTFGVSIYGQETMLQRVELHGIKEALEARGVHARYVAPREGNTLSSVVIAKQHVRELIVVSSGDGYIVGETITVQDFESWNRRDYGRPFADPKAGMLPPKVARMAVNLAGEKGTLLDPFCGMGTILGEGLLCGWRVVGSDQSPEVVKKAQKNLIWLTSWYQYIKADRSRLFVSEATHVSEHISAESVDAIVTEPLMGPAFGGNDKPARPAGGFQISHDQLRNSIKGLEKLYIGCLREWQQILKPGGKVVIALPEYAINNRTYGVKNVIDRCENLGYTVTLGPLDYGREHAVVRRKFFVLQKL